MSTTAAIWLGIALGLPFWLGVAFVALFVIWIGEGWIWYKDEVSDDRRATALMVAAYLAVTCLIVWLVCR